MAVVINGLTGIESPSVTLDTDTLVIDATNNRVGIGTASPALDLDVAGYIGSLFAGNATTPAIQIDDDSANMVGLFQAGSGSLGFSTNTTERMRIDASGNVGIGVPPSTLLHIKGANPNIRIEDNNETASGAIQFFDSVRETGRVSVASGASPVMQFNVLGSTRATIDSSGNVGIGVVPENWESPYTALQIGTTGSVAGTSANLFLSNNVYKRVSDGASTYITTNEASDYYQSEGTHVWRVASSGTADTAISWNEAMRIASSGNLLFGTTSTALASNAGINLISNGRVSATVDGGPSGEFTRINSDGDIVQFRKGSTVVGSIGVDFGDNLTIDAGAGNSGLNFATSQLAPYRGGNHADNAIDLGVSSIRWKDLYLSGGIYLGGTGAANKLDDYETGTWTPTGPNIGIATIHSAVYTKIGQLVHLFFDITRNASPADASQASSIAGLPFSANSATNDAGSTAVVKGLFQVVYTEVSGATLSFKDYSDDVLLTRSNVANKRMRCSVTYFTDS